VVGELHDRRTGRVARRDGWQAGFTGVIDIRPLPGPPSNRIASVEGLLDGERTEVLPGEVTGVLAKLATHHHLGYPFQTFE